MSVYINGIGMISPQKTENNQVFLEEKLPLEGAYFLINEPDYKEYINPKELRRMSKIIRNGIVAAKIAMAEANLDNPDAIITGTGLGCAIDTEKFLISIVENEESLLTPTSFIQSTHNTLGGSIAIGLGCHNYNMTYVHRGFSFETALVDAQLMIENGEISNALVGGFDEMTDNHERILRKSVQYDPQNGAIPGQGAGFFVLEHKKKDTTKAQFLDSCQLFDAEPDQIIHEIEFFFKEYEVDRSSLLVLVGENGIEAEHRVYKSVLQHFKGVGQADFKDWCGEYYTSSSFAFWMAAQILSKQQIPAQMITRNSLPSSIHHVLIFNIFDRRETSLILLRNAELQ